MAMIFTQTDTGGITSSNAFCSSASSGIRSGGPSRLCTVGGTAGSAPVAFGLGGEETNSIFGGAGAAHAGVLELTVPAGASWDAGDWTVRLNVTTTNMNMTITSCAVCRLNSSDVNQATIGETTGLSISLGSSGVKTITVAGSAQTPSVGDKVVILFGGDNSSMSAQAGAGVITPDQNIDSPFTLVTPSLLWSPHRFLPHLVRRVADILTPKVPAWTRALARRALPTESLLKKAA